MRRWQEATPAHDAREVPPELASGRIQRGRRLLLHGRGRPGGRAALEAVYIAKAAARDALDLGGACCVLGGERPQRRVEGARL